MREVDFYACDICSCLEELKRMAEECGEDCRLRFNNSYLLSTDSIDEAYLRIVGVTKAEYDAFSQKKQEEYERELAEHKARIPKLTEKYRNEARGLVIDSELEFWDKIVPTRLGDLYRGMELRQVLDYTVKEIADGSFTDLQDKVFIDFTKFLPTAPGPYLAAYKDRSKVGGIPFPNDAKESDYNLSVDKEVYEHVVYNYNLDDNRYHQDVVQAIADKDGSAYHLFEGNRRTEHYTFHPVFGEATIGRYISVETDMAKRCTDAFTIGVMARKPLMLGDYYGRRRPGQTEVDGQSKDGDFGVLYNLEIDNADGNPTSYNQDGELQYDTDQKNSVYANSYPSGHSSGIMACANIMMEWMPDVADKILRAANEFANSRIKCRYHNPSDTLIGRIVGTAITSVIRACKDY